MEGGNRRRRSSRVICPNVLSLMKTMDLFFDWSLGGET